MNQHLAVRLLPGLISMAFAGTAAASGFQLQNQNAAGTSVAVVPVVWTATGLE